MKKIWYILKDIILSYLIMYLAVIIFLIIYILTTDNSMILNDTITIYKYAIIGLTISMIPITIYLYKKNYHQSKNINYKYIPLMILIGISISTFYNMLTIDYQSNKTILNLSLPIIILYTSILGPIFEEILFRYTALSKAKKVLPKKYAIILISLIFALVHNNLITIIYAFILGLLLSIILEKYQNIVYPIIVHIFANLTSIFLTNSNLFLLIISTISLLIIFLRMKK